MITSSRREPLALFAEEKREIAIRTNVADVVLYDKLPSRLETSEETPE